MKNRCFFLFSFSILQFKCKQFFIYFFSFSGVVSLGKWFIRGEQGFFFFFFFIVFFLNSHFYLLLFC